MTDPGKPVRVSIGVPSLNYGRFLSTCLESIRSQTYEDLEVLIADGGSADGSLDIIARFTDVDSRFRLVSTQDTGQADAVQKTFEASTGEIFGFLNADDCYVSVDAISLAVRTLQADPEAGLVSFTGLYVDEFDTPLGPVSRRYHPRNGRRLIRYRTALLQPATFWRRHVQTRYPLRTDLSFAFDVWFFYQAFQTYGWVFRDEQIAGYRLHGANKSLGVRPERIRELASFEGFKFGAGTAREQYLRSIASITEVVGHVPLLGETLKQAVRIAVNAISFASLHRLPGI